MRKIKPRRVAHLQRRYLRQMGATPEEIRHYQPVLTAQIGAESNFTEGAGSPAGARDIAQFMPGTARSYGVKLGDNRIKDDIRGQIKYMLPLLRKYGVEGALRAYNAGPGAIERSKGFSETNNYVQRIRSTAGEYRGLGGGVGANSPAGGTRVRIPGTPGTPGSSEFLSGVDNSAIRQELKLQYLQRSHDPDALLNLAYGLKNAQDIPSRTLRTPGTPGTPGRFVYRSGKVAAPGKLQSMQAQADLLDAANNAGKLPYKWGGGHQGKVKRGTVTPVDCSGAVSSVLGINPRVASEFESWGKPGRGKRVTIWAKGDHVLMEINGRFFGTSHANPGGGAGWIPRKYLSKSYLSAFTPRHPPGL